MTDDTEKTKLPVSEETQAMLAKSKKPDKPDADQPETPAQSTNQPASEEKKDSVITEKLKSGETEKPDKPDADQPETPAQDTSQPASEEKKDSVITEKLESGETEKQKDDTLVQTSKPQPTTRQIPEPLEIERTARYGEAVLGERAKLEIILSGIEAEPIQVEVEEDFIVGRAAQETDDAPNLDLGPYGAMDKGVSRHHLVIMKRGDTLHVMDLESTNGTYLNGVWMYPSQPRVLRDGDELMLGSLVLRVKFIWQEPLLD